MIKASVQLLSAVHLLEVRWILALTKQMGLTLGQQHIYLTSTQNVPTPPYIHIHLFCFLGDSPRKKNIQTDFLNVYFIWTAAFLISHFFFFFFFQILLLIMSNGSISWALGMVFHLYYPDF